MFKPRKKSRIPSKKASDNPLARRVARGDDSPTVPLEATSAARERVDPSEAATRLINSGDGDTQHPGDPPVAVLLIIGGPGKGELFRVGYGMNSLGRGPDQRVSLDFGDERISRSTHAALTYDGEGKRFYLQPGGGAALTYQGDAPVLEPVEVVDGARIRLGATELLLRILIGKDFDWSTDAS